MRGRTLTATIGLALLSIALAGCGDKQGTAGGAGKEVEGGESIPLAALADLTLSHGQLIYVPVYSHVERTDGLPAFAFAVNVSVRNTDSRSPIAITSAKYYDSDGKLLRDYLTEPRVLKPLGTTTLFVKQSDMAGGLGANFMVEWVAEQAVTEPVVEAVMIGQREVRMCAFRSPGRVVEERAGASD